MYIVYVCRLSDHVFVWGSRWLAFLFLFPVFPRHIRIASFEERSIGAVSKVVPTALYVAIRLVVLVDGLCFPISFYKMKSGHLGMGTAICVQFFVSISIGGAADQVITAQQIAPPARRTLKSFPFFLSFPFFV